MNDLLDSLFGCGFISSDAVAEAQPYIDAASKFAGGARQSDLVLPSNLVSRPLQNPDNVPLNE